jgi:hypothetical protein
MNNKLQRTDTEQIPPWVKHFLIHVIGRCCSIVVKWIEEMKDVDKGTAQIEATGSNGRLNR